MTQTLANAPSSRSPLQIALGYENLPAVEQLEEHSPAEFFTRKGFLIRYTPENGFALYKFSKVEESELTDPRDQVIKHNNTLEGFRKALAAANSRALTASYNYRQYGQDRRPKDETPMRCMMMNGLAAWMAADPVAAFGQTIAPEELPRAVAYLSAALLRNPKERTQMEANLEGRSEALKNVQLFASVKLLLNDVLRDAPITFDLSSPSLLTELHKRFLVISAQRTPTKQLDFVGGEAKPRKPATTHRSNRRQAPREMNVQWVNTRGERGLVLVPKDD